MIIEVHSHIWYSSIWNGLVWLLGGSVWGVASCQLPATCQVVIKLSSHSFHASQIVLLLEWQYTSITEEENWFDCIVSFPILIWQRRSSLTVSRAVILRLIQRSSCRQKSIVLVVLVCWTWMNIIPVCLNFGFTKKKHKRIVSSVFIWSTIFCHIMGLRMQPQVFAKFLFEDEMSNALA